MPKKLKTLKLPLLDFFSDLPKEQKAEKIKKAEPKIVMLPDNSRAYRPIKCEAFMIIISKNNQEVSHWGCEKKDVEKIIASSKKDGKIAEAFPILDYYKFIEKRGYQI
jgi:hypothetical protein